MLIEDDPDPTVVVEIPREPTRVYDLTLRQPALPVADRFPIMTGFEVGAHVDLIADSIASGGSWRVGRAREAVADRAVIWLSPLDVPYDRQLAAWWVGGRPA